MIKHFGANFGALSAAAAAGLIAIAVATSPVMAAQREGGGHKGGDGASAGAKSGGNGGSRAGRSSGSRVSGHRGGQQRHHRGSSTVYGYVDGGYGNCNYYYSRAMATGSSYWWQRYEDCAAGY